jgi:hypothetical protein
MARIAFAVMASAVAVSPVVVGEMLPVSDTQCPPGLAPQACFATNGVTLSYEGVALDPNITVAYVQNLLQEAIKVEHGTIPLYLTNLYSVNDQSSFAAQTIRSVVMEEMLHMVQAANVLNAIGGHPFLDRPDFVPTYPLMLPLINISADITWLTHSSVLHFEILESVPPAGYNSSISAAYSHIVSLLAALCAQYGEDAVFTGDPSFQVSASIPGGESANPIHSLADATAALLGVADQGGGCAIDGLPWPQYSNISAGPLGGTYSHAARYSEILAGRQYGPNDTVGPPNGTVVKVNWTDVRRFTPNPTVDDFLMPQCVAGGSWILRNQTFFVAELLDIHHQLANYTVDTWQECADLCMAWTINDNSPLDPCAMWSWQDDASQATEQVPYHMCLLGQQWVPPTTNLTLGVISGCQFNTVCNDSLPYNGGPNETRAADGSLLLPHRVRMGSSLSHHHVVHDPPEPLAGECKAAHQRSLEFAGNYTAMLVALHNVFNGQPDQIWNTLTQMYVPSCSAFAFTHTHTHTRTHTHTIKSAGVTSHKN